MLSCCNRQEMLVAMLLISLCISFGIVIGICKADDIIVISDSEAIDCWHLVLAILTSL